MTQVIVRPVAPVAANRAEDVNAGEIFNHDGLVRNSSPIDTARQAEPFWSDYQIDAHLVDDFLDDWLIKRIVLELRV